MLEKKDKRIDGEYDPPYNFNSNPSEEEKEAANKVMEKYKKIAAEKHPS